MKLNGEYYDEGKDKKIRWKKDKDNSFNDFYRDPSEFTAFSDEETNSTSSESTEKILNSILENAEKLGKKLEDIDTEKFLNDHSDKFEKVTKKLEDIDVEGMLNKAAPKLEKVAKKLENIEPEKFMNNTLKFQKIFLIIFFVIFGIAFISIFIGFISSFFRFF